MTSQNNPANINISIWEGILKEGVPAVHVAYMVKRHIAALEALPDETEGKTQALIACREFAMRPEIFDKVDCNNFQSHIPNVNGNNSVSNSSPF